jgi:tRNA pseudouridine38-40 synthase
MRRIKITLSYDGTEYHGWQIQPDLPTIQGTLEKVVSEIEGKPVQVVGSGRTDAGAHALGQVGAFTLENRIPLQNLRKAMNRLLPPAIRVLETEEAAPEFHPRRAAGAKTYEYRIFHGEVCSPFERRYVHHFPYPLAADRVVQAAPLFEGEHDFSAFAAADEKDSLGGSKVRTIFSSRVELAGDRLFYRVKGNGFLKHMVRNVVGTLLEVGKGNLGEGDIQGLLEAGATAKAGSTAPACGLFLVSVEY